MKRFFLIFFAICAASTAFAGTFRRVSAPQADWTGEYALVFEGADSSRVFSGVDAAMGSEVVDITNNVISDYTGPTLVVAALADGGYSIAVSGGVNDGMFISSGTSAPTYSNALKFNTTPHRVDLDYVNGSVLMSQTCVYNGVDTLVTMRFNDNEKQKRFRFYKVGQQPVQLYKLEQGTGSDTATQTINTIAEIKTMEDGAAVRLTGVVTHVYNKNVYLQDATGGMLLYFVIAPSLSVGDEVVISGLKTMYGDAPEVQYSLVESVISTGNTVNAPNFATLAGACQEANIFTLVNVNNLEIVSLDSYNNPTVSDGTTTLLCYRMAVDTAVFKVGTHVDVTAVLGYYNGYQFVGNVAAIQLAQDTVPGEQPTSVTFNVIVPANTPDCYIAGSFNNWTHQQMTKLTDSTYTYVYSAANLIIDSLEYKYCAGNGWEYVEKDSLGWEIPNRRWQALDRVATWLAVPQDTVPTDDIPTLAEVKAMADSTNTKASGVVTYINGKNVYVQDATGGLLLYMKANPTFNVGDKVVVSGMKVMWGGAPELKNGVEVSAVADSIPAAASFATLADACQEANMFTLVNVNNLEIVSLDSYNNPTVSDGTTTLLCYRMAVDTAVFKVGTHVDVTAVLGYFNDYQFVGDAAGIQLAQDTMTIAQVKALENYTETQVEGVVTFINGKNVYIQDATGGLLLYMSAIPTFAVGDKVVVSGTKIMWGGAPELTNGVEVSAVADSIPAAASFASLADACQEVNMFTLVNVNNLEIVSLDSYNNPTVSDGTTTLLCYLMAVDTAVFKVGSHVDVTAVLGYYNGYEFVGDAADIQLAQDTVPGEQPTSVTFNVIVPANTPDCYIAGSFNNWTHQQMTKLTDSTYTYVYSAVNLIIDSLEYKYCAGNGWEYVEKDSLGWEIPNRRWQALDRVATWLAVPQDTVPQDTVPGEQLTSVTFNVIVPANTPDCYIAGSFNNWTHQQMTMVTANSYTLTVDSVLLSTLEYKYCAGPDWAYVEVDADGYDVMNRSWQALDRVAMWLAIPQDTVPTDDIPTLAEVKAMADSTNTKASGVVTFINGRNVYIQDATGGLNLYMSATPTFAVGDKVVVSGMKAVYGGAPELTNGVEVSAVAASIPAAASFATLADACQEANMFTLVNVNNLEIVGFGSYSNPYVSDGTTTLLCYRMVVDTAVFKVGTHVDVTAVLGYYNGYQFVGDVAGIQLAQDTVPGEQPTSVTFHVLVPDNTPTCYIAGSFNNWTHQQMTQLTANTYTYTANNIDMATLAYKYCAGNGWAYVEKDANGNDVMDRTWHEYDTVAAWANTNLVHDGLYYEITSMNTVSVIPDPTGGNYLNLTNVVIPDTVVFNYTTYQVTGIASQAFYDCTSMTTLEVGENIEQVGMAAFFGCSNLTSVVWSAKNCSEISDGNSVYAFFSATSLTDIRFGTSVETIPSALCAFRDQLTTITIPTGVKAINRYAFYGCSSLATVNLPGTLESIGYGAFLECESLTKTNFTGNLKQWCEIFIESEGSPVMYSQNLYINDVLLTHADIPEGTTAVNSFSFTNDTCLISATVPNSVTFIGTHSFNGCTNIETIEVGNGVTDLASIDNWNSAFSNCQKLKKFVYNSTMADDLSVDFWFTSPEIDTLVVPANMINNAPSYYPDHIRYIEVIDGEISSHGLSLFKANGSSLGSLLLAGASNTTLEDKAFYELYKLTNLSLPQNLQTIPYKMAADCYMLENIVIPSSVTTIGNNAFENCRSLDSVDFGTTTALQQIGNWAFYNCHNLPTLTIPEGVTYVGDGAFYGCSYLTELTLPSTMLTMGDNSFALCSRLQKMNVSAAIPPTIASKTFKDVLRSIPVYVPKASVSLYKTDEYWREFNIIGGEEQESAVDNISSEGTTKIFRDGQVLIYHNGKCYDMMGNLVE